MARYSSPEQQQLDRRQRLADLLTMQAAQPMNTGTQMAGGWAIPNSPVAPFEKLGQALIARGSQKRVERDQTAYDARRQEALAKALKSGDAQSLMENPETMELGFQLMLDERKAAADANQSALDRRAKEDTARLDRMGEFERAQLQAEARAEAARIAAEGRVAAGAGAAGATPFYQFLPGADGYYVGNARTGEIEPGMVSGQRAVPGALDPGLQGEIAGSKAAGKLTGESAAQAAIDLPGAEATAAKVSTQIDQLLAHPGFSSAVGAKGMSQLGGLLDTPIDGTDAAGFNARLEQLKGGAFLQAREILKGGGSVTDFESKKAEAAYTRMSNAVSEEEFVSAANDYRDAVRAGVQKLQARAGMSAAGLSNPVSATGQIVPSPSVDEILNKYPESQ